MCGDGIEWGWGIGNIDKLGGYGIPIECDRVG